MEKIRTVVAYKSYFEDFIKKLRPNVVRKILQILRIVETLEMIQSNFLKHIEGADGLYEIRANFDRSWFRVFCFFDSGRLVVLLGGFQKKSTKTPKKEVKKALKIKEEYFMEKNNMNS